MWSPSHLARVLTLATLALTSCAKGTTPGDDDDGGGGDRAPDANPGVGDVDGGGDPADAARADVVTLTQSESDAIVALNSVACDDLFGTTLENHYFRRFDLDAEGVSGRFTVTDVHFGVEIADAQTAELILSTVDGALELANLDELARTTVSIPDMTAASGMIDIAISAEIPAGASLVVELAVPDQFKTLYVGSNSAGERGPTYLLAPDCGIVEPTATIELPGLDGAMHWVLSVDGVVD